MVRTVARYHEEKQLSAERAKKEEKTKLRRIAATIAREIEYFWSNIEQVILLFLCQSFLKPLNWVGRGNGSLGRYSGDPG